MRVHRPRVPLVLVSGFWGGDQAEAHRLKMTALLNKPLSHEVIGRTAAAQIPLG